MNDGALERVGLALPVQDGSRSRVRQGLAGYNLRFVKLKDFVTIGSLLVALYAAEQAFAGRLERASLFLVLSWAFDALDGLVARLTGTGDAFGAHLDDVVDHVAYTVAPAFVVFNAYAPHGRWLAFLLMFAMVAVGTIRLARHATTPASVPGYWIGLPRPAFGFMLVFFLNSPLFRAMWGPAIGAALVAVMSVLSLTHLPYRNHKRPFSRRQRAALVALLIGCVGLYPLGQAWNAASLLTGLYLLAPWIALNRTERAAIARAVSGATSERN